MSFINVFRHHLLASLRTSGFVLLILSLVNSSVLAGTGELKLPNLGSTSTSLFSTQYEHELGKAWLRMYRTQAKTLDDPLLYDYIENLLFELITHSELEDRRVELVIADNPTMNAFAVPGGIIGVHSGMLLHAQTEGELASVLAHEIAHLSQRHFSRTIQQRRANQPLTLAAILAGFVLLAASGSQAGMAALSAAQAAAADAALRYSRSNEQEADRIGMQTLSAAGFDPAATATMFERMMATTRFYSKNKIPEFLRTHPLSENRVADARNRAMNYPKRVQTHSLDYQLMRARVQLQQAKTPQQAIQFFRGQLNGKPISQEAAHYGLVLALTAAGQTKEARQQLNSIWQQQAGRIEYTLADAAIDSADQQPERAAQKLAKALQQTPGNHPLTMAYTNALVDSHQPHRAESVLSVHSRKRPNDPSVWYLLAEVQGLTGNIVGLHQARAEFFILRGNLDQAQAQLKYALKLIDDDFITSTKITQRLKDIHQLRDTLDKL